MDINKVINELISALISTSAFQEMRASRSAINKNSQIAYMLDSFEKKRTQAYSPEISQNQQQRLLDELTSDFNKLSSIPEFKRFFQASDNFNEYVGGVIDRLMSGLDSHMR